MVERGESDAGDACLLRAGVIDDSKGTATA